MKILWLSNALFPEVCQELKMEAPAVGGWMYSGADALLKSNPHIKLAVASLYSGNRFQRIDKYNICYYLIPGKNSNQKYNQQIESYFQQVNSDFNPHLVHLHGSEYPHSLAWIKACGNKGVIVSIQGLVSVYARYFLGGISVQEIKKSITLRDRLRFDSLLDQQKNMYKRGEYEIELLKNVRHIIGRTSWDRSNAWAINPNATYHFCNETLRQGFYVPRWDYHHCEKNSIFLSQAHYPIKGIQQVIKALPLILREFPDAKVYVAGYNFIDLPKFRQNGFASYLKKLMQKLQTSDKFHFLGMLNEKQMVSQYLKANVFVCPSSIENSPNSVGEAQLLGTPCIASYVGGSMDMIEEGKSGYLYRFEETELLALRICEIFRNPEYLDTLSTEERKKAEIRHNPVENGKCLNAIYCSVLNKSV